MSLLVPQQTLPTHIFGINIEYSNSTTYAIDLSLVTRFLGIDFSKFNDNLFHACVDHLYDSLLAKVYITGLIKSKDKNAEQLLLSNPRVLLELLRN